MSVLKWIGGVLLALILLLLVWGSLIEPRFLLDAETHDAEVMNLPPAWDGQTLALLADFQVGMWMDNVGMIEKAVARAAEVNPAAVLIAGDFVYKPDSAVVREAVGLIRPLTDAGIPVIAVLGNHDYSLMDRQSEIREPIARFLETELEAAGVRVLENEAFALRRDGEPLYLVGVGSEWAGRSRPDVALAGVPAEAARVLFMHNPVAFRDLPPRSGSLTLAGHTHGGQVRLPILPSESWLDIARPREVVADGWAADTIGAVGNRLYVSRGLGFSAVPVRIMCRPEISLFTLRRAAGDVPQRGPETGPEA